MFVCMHVCKLCMYVQLCVHITVYMCVYVCMDVLCVCLICLSVKILKQNVIISTGKLTLHHTHGSQLVFYLWLSFPN